MKLIEKGIKMSNEIIIDNERKIRVTLKSDKYYALQVREYNCSHYVTRWRFETKEEALKKIRDKSNFEYSSGIDYRIIYVEEIEDYVLLHHPKTLRRTLK